MTFRFESLMDVLERSPLWVSCGWGWPGGGIAEWLRGDSSWSPLISRVVKCDLWPSRPPLTQHSTLAILVISNFFSFSPGKWQTFFIPTASQPPTTIPPPTTEVVETTTQKKIVNYLPPVGQTTVYTVHMVDKGEQEISHSKFNLIHFRFLCSLSFFARFAFN